MTLSERSCIRCVGDGETTYILYDHKARPVHYHKKNYLGGYTNTDHKIDFMGKILKTETKHKRLASDTEIKTRELFVFSAQDRLLSHTHKINSLPTQLLAENTYDELGNLISKKTGNVAAAPLQKIDYRYNIRGWLTGINNDPGNSLALNVAENDLFGFKINYNTTEGQVPGIRALYNGNIAETYWRTASDNILRKYSYGYDGLNRLGQAIYHKPELADPMPTHAYNEQLSYDKNGNITHLWRNGNQDFMTGSLTIDDLSYTYHSVSNRLKMVMDATNSSEGFKDNANATTADIDYTYDALGNMIADNNKGITSIKYNHLNLPVEIIFNNDADSKITYLYNAIGEKVEKTVKGYAGDALQTYDYFDGYQYRENTLLFFPTREGYVSNTEVAEGNNYNYVYNYTDHLGNIRLRYSKDPATGLVKILEEHHYYPFGLDHRNYNSDLYAFQAKDSGDGVELRALSKPIHSSLLYKYKFQGQERQTDLGLNWDSFKWRNYDYAIGRFMSIDPLTEEYNTWSPYTFSGNRVIDARELEGLEPYVVTGRTFIPDAKVNNPYSSVMKTQSFSGDNRNSYKVNTSAYRTEQKVRVDFENKTATTLSNRANSTTGYDKNGNVTAKSDPAKAGPTPTYTSSTMDNGSTTVHMQADASNQLVPAPAINYDVNVNISEQSDGTFNYNISGQSDGFPAYEFFITNEANNKSYLIHGSNPAQMGSDPNSLLPPMERNINSSGNSNDLKPVEEVKF